MFVKSRHSRGVSLASLIRAVYYIYLAPRNGYLRKMRDRFGTGARLLLNTELALTTIIKYLPGKQPGMVVGIDIRNIRRFGKLVEKLGLKVVVYDGESELIELLKLTRLLAVILPDSYDAMSRINKNTFDKSMARKIIYQNRKRPKSVDLLHDVYIWEPRTLPRTVSGAIVVTVAEDLEGVRSEIKAVNHSRPNMPASSFIREIYYATKGYENKYRRVDKSPPRVLARMLYDFYK